MKAKLSAFRIAQLAAGRWLILTVLLCAAGLRADEATFTNVTESVVPGLPQVGYSSVAWADFDNDGRLDFLITGISFFGDDGGHGATNTTQLWRNTGNGFSNVTATLAPSLPRVWYSSVAWGDYDNDGRLDFLLTGYFNSNRGFVSQLWRNTGSGFTNVTATVAPGLPGVGGGSVAWGDFDNDGRLDFLLTGHSGWDSNGHGIFISQIWRNTGSGFTNVTDTVAPGLPGVYAGSVAWGDFDSDGRLDFLISGGIPRRTDRDDDVALTPISQLWRNTGSGFVNVTATVAPGLPGVFWSSVAWADYDNDGRLDFVLTGATGSSRYSQIWRNTESGFVNVTPTVAPDLPAVYFSSVAWGDYDNDGRLDLLLTGEMSNSGPWDGPGAQIWRNTPGGFTNVTASVAPGLTGIVYSSVAWGDFDNDGRLDILLTGALDGGCDVCDPPATVSQLWRNNTAVTNTPPTAPTGLAMTASSNAVMLSWNSATDDQTPASGLTYNVRAGTTPGGNDLLSAHVNATNGFRRVPAMGNAMLRHSLPLTGPTNGQTVYWSVQAVDTSFAGGPFATETSVVSLPALSVSLNSSASAQSSGATAPKQSEGGQPSTLNLSWTPPTFGWVLQQSSNVNASNWTMTASGSANPTTLPGTNAAQFYRLSKP